MSDLSDIETLRLTLRGMANLDEMQAYLVGQYKMAELEALATDAGVEAPASTKGAVAEQIIAELTSNEEANVVLANDMSGEISSPSAADYPVGKDLSTVEGGPNDPRRVDDAASSGQGVLPEEGRGKGVGVPAKVAAMEPEQLWTEILGWEIDQGLDADARAAFSDDQLREYLGYLWHMGALGRAPRFWQTIEVYFADE